MPDKPIADIGANTIVDENEDGHTVLRNTLTGAEMTLADATKLSEPLGTEDEPIPDQSHFESVSAERTENEAVGYYTARDDDELDDVLSRSSRGDWILLGANSFEKDRTLDVERRFTGMSGIYRGDETSIEGEWVFESARGQFENMYIRDADLVFEEGRYLHFSNVVLNIGHSIILEDIDRSIFSNIGGRGEIYLGQESSGNTVGSRTDEITIVDDGDNNIMPLS